MKGETPNALTDVDRVLVKSAQVREMARELEVEIGEWADEADAAERKRDEALAEVERLNALPDMPEGFEAMECDDCAGRGWYKDSDVSNEMCEVCRGTGRVVTLPASWHAGRESEVERLNALVNALTADVASNVVRVPARMIGGCHALLLRYEGCHSNAARAVVTQEILAALRETVQTAQAKPKLVAIGSMSDAAVDAEVAKRAGPAGRQRQLLHLLRERDRVNPDDS